MEDQREGLGLLLTDLRVMMLLLSEGRYQLLHRAFGITRDQANIVTLLLVAGAAAGLQDRLETLTRPPSREQMAGVWLGGALVRELLSQAAGPALRKTPHTGDLLMLVAMAAVTRPVLRTLAEWQPGRRAFHAFRHRYGHLMPYGRPAVRPAPPLPSPAA